MELDKILERRRRMSEPHLFNSSARRMMLSLMLLQRTLLFQRISYAVKTSATVPSISSYVGTYGSTCDNAHNSSHNSLNDTYEMNPRFLRRSSDRSGREK